MERLHSPEAQFVRRIARLMVVLASACLIAYVITSLDFTSRAVLFEILGAQRAEAGETGGRQLGKLRLMTRCIGYIRNNYVAPQRVKPIPMLLGALKGAQGMVPDLMVTAEKDDPERSAAVTVRIGEHERLFDVSRVTDLYEMNWRLLDIFEFISQYLPSDVSEDDVEYAAINGLLGPLDEHSVYLPPAAYKEMQLDTQGRFGGLGIVITTRKGLVTIVSVLPETPAAREGLKPGDQIIQIGEESTMNMKLNDAVSKLRGPPGTRVTVLVQRKDWPEPRLFPLTRAEIRIQSVSSQSLGDGIGYVHLKHFQEDTESELLRQVGDLKKKGALNGLVFDLRGNPGGLLEQAVEVGRLFMSKGTIVVTEGEGRRMRQDYDTDGDAAFAGVPMVVLVDNGSASAAEIVAGAIKGNDRGMLVGNTTFGKGTVQVLYEVGEGKGALKLTVAQYLTPGDISIHGVGVIPDIEMVPVSIASDRISFGPRDDHREIDPKRRLEPFGKVSGDKPSTRLSFLLAASEDGMDDGGGDDEDAPPVKDDAFKPDDLVKLASTILKDARSNTRKAALQQAENAIRAFAGEQDSKIAQRLTSAGIDWTPGPVHADLPVRLSWSIDRKDGLMAGQKAKVRLTARNDGLEPVFRVHAATDTDLPALDDREFVFGRIAPGESIVRETSINLGKDLWDRVDQVTFRLYQGDTEVGRPETAFMVTHALQRPRFAYSYQVQDSGGNGDGLLSPGETMDLLLDIRNIGNGPAGKVLATVRNKSGEAVVIRDGRVTLKDGIPIGRTVPTRFRMDIKRTADVPSITVEVGILDIGLREYLSEDIVIPVAKAAPVRFEAQRAALRTTKTDARVLSAAADGAALLYSLPENFYLRSLGRLGEYYKIDADDGRFAFVRVTDVEPTVGVVRFAPPPDVPSTNFIQPGVEVHVEGAATQGPAGDSITVNGQVRFSGRPGEARRTVLIFRGDDKVYFWTRSGPTVDTTVPVEARIPVVKGRNEIAVYAIEGKQRSTVRRFTVFSESVKGASAPVTSAGPQDTPDHRTEVMR